MVKKIALEEHFLSPEFIEHWLPTVAEMPAAKRDHLLGLNTDFGERRLASMDKAGIEHAVWRLAGPGAQAERDTAKAIRDARSSNDFLAKEIQKRPDRYSGFAHLAMQDAKAAADELERCVKELKFCGAMINGHTNGQYLDHPSLAPFWERAEALGTLIYMHPADPVSVAPVLARPSGAAPRHLGMGLRDRLARAAADFRRGVRPLPKGAARPRPPGRDLAVSALALRQPHRPGLLQRGLEEAGVALHQEQHRDHHVGHVLGRAAELRHRRTWP